MKANAQSQSASAMHRSALLVVDVQDALFHKGTPIYGAATLLANIKTLAARAHSAGAPVIYIQHDDGRSLVRGSDGWRLHLALQPAPEDLVVQKQHPNAFEQTTLAAELQARNIDQLVVTGLVTHGCVRATCLGAQKLGYAVTLAADAHSSYNKDAAGLIEEWNAKLAAQGIAVIPTAEISLAGAANPIAVEAHA